MQSSNRQRGPRLWVVVIGVAVIAAAVGLVGREVYKPRAAPSVNQETVTPVPSTTVPLAEQPGPGQVLPTSDAASHPAYGAVGPVLQEYFDAINAKNFDRWRTTVTRDRLKAVTQQSWQNDFRTTKDGSILVYRIDQAWDRNKLRALVAFTSTQDPEDAPLEFRKPCIRWRIVLPMTKEDNKWKIDTGPEATTPQHDECASQ